MLRNKNKKQVEILVSFIVIGLLIFLIIKESKDKKKHEKEKAELEERMRREGDYVQKIIEMLSKKKKIRKRKEKQESLMRK